MSRLLVLLGVLATLANTSFGADPKAPAQVREWRPAPFHIVDYRQSPRDPMISASVTATLLNGARPTESNQIAAGQILSQFLEPIIKELKGKLHVGGVAMSNPGVGRALISGIDVASGDRLVVPVAPSVGKRVLGVANTFGLPVEYVQLANDEIGLVIIVSEIRPSGVILRLPKFGPPLCALNYDPDLTPSVRRLETPVTRQP